MYNDTHGVPGYSVSGVNATERFMLEVAPHGGRIDAKFATAAVGRHVLVKVGTAGALEKVTAATDQVFGVTVEPKSAGVLDFYVFTNCTINRELLNFDEMGITDADLDQLQTSNASVIFTRPIYSGAE